MCAHCGKRTRTIAGGCPNCGKPKEDAAPPPPAAKARGGSWLDDLPVLEFAMGTTGVGIVVALAILVGWEVALGLAALLLAATYLLSELGVW
jgi:hypothetical protein